MVWLEEEEGAMAVLIVMSGNAKGRRLEINRRRVTLGRATDNLVELDDTSVSAHHCSVSRDGQKYTLKDLNSTNGTRLNGAPVTESRLKPRDLITAGGIEIMFDGDDVEVDDSTPAPAVAETVAVEGAVSRSAPAGVSSAFGVRRQSKSIWLILIVVVGVLALAALGWFVMTLFKS